MLLGGAAASRAAAARRRPGRESWPRRCCDGLPALLARYDGREVVALASGDPLVSGIGTTLIELLGEGGSASSRRVSSVALARARMRWPAESAAVVVAGRPRPAPRARASSRPAGGCSCCPPDATTPATVARLLAEHGVRREPADRARRPRRGRRVPHRGRRRADGGPRLARLNVVALELRRPGGRAWTAGLPDDGVRARRPAHQARPARLGAGPARAAARASCSGTSAPAPARSASSGCARTHAAGRSRSSPTTPAPSGSGATPPGSAYPSLRVVHGPRARRAGRPARPGRGLRRRRRDGARAARRLPGARCAPGGRLVVHGVTARDRVAARRGVRRARRRAAPASRSSTPRRSARSPAGRPAARVTQWSWSKPVTVHFVGAGPGAADLLTLRAAALLAAADVVLYPGTYLDEAVLAHCRDGRPARRHPGPRPRRDHRPSWSPPTRPGVDAVRLTSGDPSVYSALAEQTRRLDAAGRAVGRDARGPGVRRGRRAGRPRADGPAGRAVGRADPHPGALDRDAGDRVAGRASPPPGRRWCCTWRSPGPAS